MATLKHHQWDYKWVPIEWRVIWQYLLQLQMYIPLHPEIPFLGNFPADIFVHVQNGLRKCSSLQPFIFNSKRVKQLNIPN